MYTTSLLHILTIHTPMHFSFRFCRASIPSLRIPLGIPENLHDQFTSSFCLLVVLKLAASELFLHMRKHVILVVCQCKVGGSRTVSEATTRICSWWLCSGLLGSCVPEHCPEADAQLFATSFASTEWSPCGAPLEVMHNNRRWMCGRAQGSPPTGFRGIPVDCDRDLSKVVSLDASTGGTRPLFSGSTWVTGLSRKSLYRVCFVEP